MKQNETTGKVVQLTESSFKAAVMEDTRPILIDFWAPWCGPCRMMKPVLNKVAETIGDEVRVAQINVDDEPGLAQAFGIRGIPTMVLISGGRVLDSVTGVVAADRLIEQVRGKLAAAGAGRNPANG